MTQCSERRRTIPSTAARGNDTVLGATATTLSSVALMDGTGGLPQLTSSTMLDDAAKESLTGGADLDWFFATALDRLVDRLLLEFVS